MLYSPLKKIGGSPNVLSFRTLLNLTKADLTVEQMPKADPALQNPAKSFGIPKQILRCTHFLGPLNVRFRATSNVPQMTTPGAKKTRGFPEKLVSEPRRSFS